MAKKAVGAASEQPTPEEITASVDDFVGHLANAPEDETRPVTFPAVRPAGPGLQPMSADPQTWLTSFDKSTFAGKAALINCQNPPDWMPQDGGTFDMTLTGFAVYPDVVTDRETGEVKNLSRVALLGSQGEVVKFSSDHAGRRLLTMARLFTPDEWKAGIPIRCSTEKSRQPGRSDYGTFQILTLPSV